MCSMSINWYRNSNALDVSMFIYGTDLVGGTIKNRYQDFSNWSNIARCLALFIAAARKSILE